MNSFNISLMGADDETVQADYYQFESGWVTFKKADGKAIASYPEVSITRIRAIEADPPKILVTVSSPRELTAEDLSKAQRDAFLAGVQ